MDLQTKQHYKLGVSFLALLIVLSALGATLVSGQGGTGRETNNRPAPKKKPTPKPASKRTPTSGTGKQPTNSQSKASPTPTREASNGRPKSIRSNSGIELVWIPPGSFMMGSENGDADEKPVHRVTLVVNEEAAAMARFEMPKAETEFQTTRRELSRAKSLLEAKVLSQADYDAARERYNAAKEKLDSLRPTTGEYGLYMGKYEVTQSQWQQVMGNNPSYFKDCANCPVEQVSWEDAQEFLDKLNDANDGFRYRLPTEAEWEYACRAGTTGDYAGSLDSLGWYSGNSGGKTHAVGKLSSNAFGLYDMHGNVWEWCQDRYHENYNGAPGDGSAWLSGGEQKYRMLRGGSWNGAATFLRSAGRNDDPPDVRSKFFGFRVVAVARTQ